MGNLGLRILHTAIGDLEVRESRGGWYYVTAPAVASRGYQPGLVNEVSFRALTDGTGRWFVRSTDGYRVLPGEHYETMEGALDAVEHAMIHGAGGGFGTRLEPADQGDQEHAQERTRGR